MIDAATLARRSLLRPVVMCPTCRAAAWLEHAKMPDTTTPREDLRGDRVPLTTIPPWFHIQRIPAKVARGAVKPRSGGSGALPTSTISARAERRGLTSYAARR